MRFQVLKAANIKMAVFWVVGSWSGQKFTDVSDMPAACIFRTITHGY
jgi:hypothetical protein